MGPEQEDFSFSSLFFLFLLSASFSPFLPPPPPPPPCCWLARRRKQRKDFWIASLPTSLAIFSAAQSLRAKFVFLEGEREGREGGREGTDLVKGGREVVKQGREEGRERGK